MCKRQLPFSFGLPVKADNGDCGRQMPTNRALLLVVSVVAASSKVVRLESGVRAGP
jgi:hypothetical protein